MAKETIEPTKKPVRVMKGKKDKKKVDVSSKSKKQGTSDGYMKKC